MRTLVRFLFLPLILVASAAAADTRLAKEIERAVAAELDAQKIPGAAVAVLRGDEIVVARGFGFANLEHRVAATPDTIFQLGSVGKQFTAAGVMLLVADGKIALDDPLTKHLPEAPASWSNITIRHLLTHTSGIPDYTPDTIDFRRDYSEEELAQFAYRLKREFAPGSRWNYSNTGYILLGIISRAAGGKFYGDLLSERLFKAAGMRTARVISEEDIVPNRAAGYRLVDGEIKNQAWVAPKLNTTADGSLYVSLNDMIAWARAIRGKRLLPAGMWDEVIAPMRLVSGNTYPYGMGWDVAPLNGRARMHHGGSWQGFKSYISRFPAEDLTVIVLANLAQANPETVAAAALRVIDRDLVDRPLQPIKDDQPEVTNRVRTLLAAAAAGQLDAAQFAYLRAGFFPDGAAAYQKRLSALGPIAELTLLDRQQLGDDTIHTYDVRAENGSIRLRIGIAPDGKLSEFRLMRP